jgi:hypothetical protein
MITSWTDCVELIARILGVGCRKRRPSTVGWILQMQRRGSYGFKEYPEQVGIVSRTYFCYNLFFVIGTDAMLACLPRSFTAIVLMPAMARKDISIIGDCGKSKGVVSYWYTFRFLKLQGK